MFTMQYREGKGWFNPAIEPYQAFALDPACIWLHYAQLIFEGLKAYRGKRGEIYLFRPLENARRMNNSARRLCMPAVDENLFLEAVRELVLLEKDWIPKGLGTSLYIRPTMIATEPALGVHASPDTSSSSSWPRRCLFPEDSAPRRSTWRALRPLRSGGIGYCKAAANYAASLYASKAAQDKGYTQVLWLDAVHKKYVEEVGTSNIFFLIGDELVTPPLGGTILPGVTRDSVIEMARSWGFPSWSAPLPWKRSFRPQSGDSSTRHSPPEQPPSFRPSAECSSAGRSTRSAAGRQAP
jgi:branched-chain amino acid aminotransferase